MNFEATRMSCDMSFERAHIHTHALKNDMQRPMIFWAGTSVIYTELHLYVRCWSFSSVTTLCPLFNCWLIYRHYITYFSFIYFAIFFICFSCCLVKHYSVDSKKREKKKVKQRQHWHTHSVYNWNISMVNHFYYCSAILFEQQQKLNCYKICSCKMI